MPHNKSMRSKLLFFFGMLLGVLAFLLVFGEASLDVTNDAFCRGGFVEKDIQQHYAGWLFLRGGVAQGLCTALNINWPDGISVAYTDSIPLFAAIFRLIVPVLPETFQYFGMFTLLCFALQGGFSALLLGLFWDGIAAPVVGSAFFTLSPVLLERSFRHTALAAQFFILAALWYYFRSHKEERFDYPGLWIICAGTLSIHPYLVPMVYAILFALIMEYALRNRTWMKPLLYLASALMGTMLVGFAFGIFTTGGTGGSEALYGYFSMNLNALWNPASVGETSWSLFLPLQNQIRGNYDAFNYLGAAGLVLTALAGIMLVLHRCMVLPLLRCHWCLFLVCCCLTAFAVTNQVTANGVALFTIPLPASLIKLCSIFRSGGRLFWPVYYLILLFSLKLVRNYSPKRLFPVILCCAVVFQATDLSPAILARHREMTDYTEEFPTEMTQDFWKAAERYSHIFSLDGIQADSLHLALYAADHGMTTNDPFAARYDVAGLTNAREEALADLLGGDADSDTLYLMQDEGLFLRIADIMQNTAWCGKIGENWFAIAPGLEYSCSDSVRYSEEWPIRVADYTDENWKNGVLTWDSQTILVYDSPLARRRLENASRLEANGVAYPIIKVDDKDAGWLMVTLDTDDASLLCGAELTPLS